MPVRHRTDSPWRTCSSRQLAANRVVLARRWLRRLRKLHLAGSQMLQAGSLCSPERNLHRYGRFYRWVRIARGQKVLRKTLGVFEAGWIPNRGSRIAATCQSFPTICGAGLLNPSPAPFDLSVYSSLP